MQIYENLMIWTNFLWVVCPKSAISEESTTARVLDNADYSPRERLFEQYRDAVYVLILSDEPSLSFLRRAHMFLVFFCFVAALFLFQLLGSFSVGLNAVAD